jgi:hypothetical protein
MASEGSVTHWIRLLKEGDQAAAQPLWEAYFHLPDEEPTAELAAQFADEYQHRLGLLGGAQELLQQPEWWRCGQME